jgi:tetratricopeptide (TPR) repeat protein
MLGERNPSQHSEDEGVVKDGVGSVARGAAAHGSAATVATSDNGESVLPHEIDVDYDAPEIEQAPSVAPGVSTGRRWWLLAAVSALILTGLTVAGTYLVTKKPSTVDQLVILTVPSGADIKLDSRDYGHSPVKLERLAFGTYTLTISKEGYEPIVESLNVVGSGQPVEYKLRPIPPPESADLPLDEQIRQYQLQAEEAFARGYFGIPYDLSALYYADIVQRLDPNSTFTPAIYERVRKAAHQTAQSAITRGDLAQAQEVYNFLVEYYPTDEEARTAAAKLENQLSRALGQVRELVRKADEAFQAGQLIDPTGKSAYFYSKQALAIDRQNERARQIRNQIKETLVAVGEQSNTSGEFEAAIRQLEQVGQLFPEDKQSRARVREIKAAFRASESAKALEPVTRRIRGLQAYGNGLFEAAIPDLEHAVVTGQGNQAVIFALARSYLKTLRLDQAESFFHQVRPTAGEDVYRSSIAALGEIAYQRGDFATAVEKWKQARQLGGSVVYPVAMLDDKIERIEKKQREKAAEPSPLTLQVKHLHGGLLGGSCSGTLTINATGVRYDGEHVYASNLVGAGVSLTKDEMVITFQGNTQKFRVARGDAERVRETISRYQQTYSPASK